VFSGPIRLRVLLFLAVFQVTSLKAGNSLGQSSAASSTNEASLQVIVVRSPEEADELLQRLKKGEDFSTLAKQDSIDPTAESGGFMGTVDPNSLRAELRDALKGVTPGNVTPVIHIPSGYAILKVMNNPAPNSLNVDPARNFALSAAGTVKYSLDVGGLPEAEGAILRSTKPANWNHTPRAICTARKKSLKESVERLKDYLGPANAANRSTHPPIDIMQLHFGLAQLYSYLGDMDHAIEEFQASYEIALASVPNAVPQMEEALGVIHLHKAEMVNEVFTAPGKKCLIPIAPADAFKKPEDSLKAIEYFLKYLDKKPNELEVVWLLNLAYMTTGKYPDQVPQKYLISPSIFAAQPDYGRFVDVDAETGLNSFSSAGGVIVDDFENNGLLDVITSGFESCGPMHYFHNNGDGTFTDQTEKAGLGDVVGGLNLIQTDYNNDGCIDFLILRGGWEFPQPRSLFRNNCNGTFTDVTVEAGLAAPTSSQAAVWVDINNDGLLDLFIGNENGPPQLFLNKGNGKFEDISYESGVAADATIFAKGVTAADYDGDGYVDLYVSNLNGNNLLFHNNHDNTFTEVSDIAGVPGNRKGFATWFFDYNNDGLPDLFVTSYFTSVEETARTYLGLPHNAATMKLYKNLGNGKFQDVTEEAHLDKVFMPMGSNFGDLDNDGFLDIYMGTGNPSYSSLVPSVLLHNHEGKFFEDITFSSGTGELDKGHAIAFADLARTGNEDIIASVGGATPGDRHALRVFRNPGHGNDWINLKLVGVKTNRVAIGARIKVTVQNDGLPVRTIWRTVGSGGSFGASPLEQHIGLGKSAQIQSLEIFWPVSKTHQTFTAVAKNQFLEIKELANTYAKLDRKPFHLGKQQESVAGATTSDSPGTN